VGAMRRVTPEHGQAIDSGAEVNEGWAMGTEEIRRRYNAVARSANHVLLVGTGGVSRRVGAGRWIGHRGAAAQAKS